MVTVKPIIVILLLVSVAAFLIPGANAECKACKGEGTDEDWANSASSFLEGKPLTATEPIPLTAKLARQGYEALKSDESSSNTPEVKTSDTASSNEVSAVAIDDADSVDDTGADDSGAKKEDNISPNLPQRSESFSRVLVPVSADLGGDIILDISPNATEYIPGAINVNYENFLGDDKKLKPLSEIAQIFGNAGISQDDSVIIYGECQPCGGGPSAATYVYWIMKYMGHENVRLLDGGIDDWVAAKRPTDTAPAVASPKTYTPTINPELLATYEYVKNGGAQIVDARTSDQLVSGTIPGAVNIPYEDVLENKRIKDEAKLASLFSGLDKNKPVVIYTDTGVKATMPWFVLTLLGYDARLYSWQDWLANTPRLNISLKEVKAEPNPAKTGDVVKITAVFQEKAGSVEVEQAVQKITDVGKNVSNETILTIKGCATCGFGSPQGFADISSNSGIVQIGSKGKASAQDTGFKCTATIASSIGAYSGKVIMKRISGDEFAGIWNANVAAGKYDVSIVASAGDITETFPNVLEIEVAGSSKYKNLG